MVLKKANKKGLSDIITTVLIILLALAAVILIWAFIKKPVEQGGKAIGTQGECFTLQLKPTGCIISNDNTTATVTVQWAGGDVTLQRIKFIVADKSGANNVSEAGGPSSILGTQTTTVGVDILDENSLVLSAAGIIKTTNGDEGTCAETLERLSCKWA